MANLLEAALLSYPTQQECKSTEEMLAKIDADDLIIKEKGVDICVGSGDVVGLYPSFRHKKSAEMCASMIMNATTNFKYIDVKSAGVFIATNCSNKEIKDWADKCCPQAPL